MYYYPVSAVLTECLILSVVEFRGVPGKEAQVLFHHRGRTQSSGISEERVERIPRYHR